MDSGQLNPTAHEICERISTRDVMGAGNKAPCRHKLRVRNPNP